MDPERRRLLLIHIIEGMVSAAANLLTIGIYFFMENRFGWTLRQNFMLSAAQGAVYIVGALLAHGLTARFGRRMPLAIVYFAIAGVTLVAGIFTTPTVCTVVILAFAFLSAITWPIVESLVSDGESDPHELSRRLARYNIVWASTGSAVIAINGLIIETFPSGVFLLATLVCGVSGILVLLCRIEPERSCAPVVSAPEPQLVRQRVVALWLSRISVPAMYLMINSLAAMLPSLPVLQPMRPAMQTLVSSVWLVTRCIVFIVLGYSTFWHTRPRLLLGAAFVLLLSLLAITVPNSLAVMIAGQIAFGVATGLIYSASLYFGMVLSEGSTEHGGYHEALIGVGMTLGPAVGAGTQYLYPGNQGVAVAAIAGLIGVSILFSSVASLRFRRS